MGWGTVDPDGGGPTCHGESGGGGEPNPLSHAHSKASGFGRWSVALLFAWVCPRGSAALVSPSRGGVPCCLASLGCPARVGVSPGGGSWLPSSLLFAGLSVCPPLSRGGGSGLFLSRGGGLWLSLCCWAVRPGCCLPAVLWLARPSRGGGCARPSRGGGGRCSRPGVVALPVFSPGVGAASLVLLLVLCVCLVCCVWCVCRSGWASLVGRFCRVGGGCWLASRCGPGGGWRVSRRGPRGGGLPGLACRCVFSLPVPLPSALTVHTGVRRAKRVTVRSGEGCVCVCCRISLACVAVMWGWGKLPHSWEPAPRPGQCERSLGHLLRVVVWPDRGWVVWPDLDFTRPGSAFVAGGLARPCLG